jgi:hypothetical protein
MPDWLDVSATAPRIAYTATSGQTAFAVPFEFLEEEHLAIYQNDTLLTLTTDYTVSGEGDEDGGTITLETGATAGDSIVIALDVPLELTTHIPVTGRLDVPAINLQFTLLMMLIKQLDANRVRSLRQPDSDTDDLDDLPAAASRANKYLAFDSDGQPSLVSSVSSAVAATAFMLTLLDDTTAAQARATLGIADQSAYTGLSNWQFCR